MLLFTALKIIEGGSYYVCNPSIPAMLPNRPTFYWLN